MEETGLNRRQFLQVSGASALMLSLHSLGFLGGRAEAAQKVIQEWDYGKWEDLHRKEWTWDKVTWGTHLVDCYPGNCLWRVYTKDGVVIREEQAAKYPVVDSTSPDFNPRGCQKGACYSGQMLGPDRITHPLERVGPRGSGRWRRIPWDRALTRVADAILDAIQEGGPETVVYDNGTSNVDIGPSSVGEMRLFSLLGATMLDGFGGTGDLAMGAVQTWGTSFVDGSSDDWMRADTLIFWHSNPAVTRLPDMLSLLHR